MKTVSVVSDGTVEIWNVEIQRSASEPTTWDLLLSCMSAFSGAHREIRQEREPVFNVQRLKDTKKNT